jgi:hypothetical protein
MYARPTFRNRVRQRRRQRRRAARVRTCDAAQSSASKSIVLEHTDRAAPSRAHYSHLLSASQVIAYLNTMK